MSNVLKKSTAANKRKSDSSSTALKKARALAR